jgi:hypothetical protein
LSGLAAAGQVHLGVGDDRLDRGGDLGVGCGVAGCRSAPKGLVVCA